MAILQNLTKTIETAVGETVREFGKVDWVVNNAGWGQIGIFEATSREKAMEQLSVNLVGLSTFIKYCDLQFV